MPFVVNIEKSSIENQNFRKVLYTSKHEQLVVMSLNPGEDIGMEVHPHTDQFIRVDQGSGEAILNGKRSKLENGSAVVIPAGTRHNIVNTGDGDLKVYTIYSPPHHREGTVHKTKEDAMADKRDIEPVESLASIISACREMLG